jgi:hypothetical protein
MKLGTETLKDGLVGSMPSGPAIGTWWFGKDFILGNLDKSDKATRVQVKSINKV